MIKITFGLLGFIALFAFKSPSDNSEKNAPGNYGHSSTFEIILNDDHTFSYVDLTKGNPIKVNGKWSMNGDKIVFTDYPSDAKILHRFTLANEGKCLKSKKMFTYYSICKKCD